MTVDHTGRLSRLIPTVQSLRSGWISLDGIRLFSTCLIALLLAACVGGPSHNTMGADFQYRPGLVAGESQRIDVIALFGEPSIDEPRGDYRMMAYHFRRTLGDGYDERIEMIGVIPVLGIVSLMALENNLEESYSGIGTRRLVVFLDGSDRVVDFFYNENIDGVAKGHDLSETLRLKGMQAIPLNKLDEAESLFRKSIAENGNNHRAINSLAALLLDKKGGEQYEEALELAERAVAIFPGSPYNLSVLGSAHWKMENRTEALNAFQKSVDLFPRFAPDDLTALRHDQAMLRWLDY